MVTHICPICGNSFESKRCNAVFCSKKCKSRSRRHRPKIIKPDILTCPQCGKEFKPEKKNQKYCCRECQVKYGQARKKEVRKTTIPKRATCLICGKYFKPFRFGAKCCSKECQRESNRIRAAERYKKFGHNYTKTPEKATCPVCGKTFKTHHANQKNCSKECTHRLSKINENTRERKKFELLHQKPDRHLYSNTCTHCGKLFITVTYAAKYCSVECKKAQNDNVRQCKYCGKVFSQSAWGTNPFCSGKCELAYYKKCGEELSKKTKAAKDLGLSYGEYMGYIQLGLSPADFARTY